MSLRNGRRACAVSGPLLWEGEPPATRVQLCVRIEQHGRVVEQDSGHLEFGPVDREWMFVMELDGRIRPGVAVAYGEARPVDDPDEPLASWSQVVEFREAFSPSMLQEAVDDSVQRAIVGAPSV